MKYGEMLWTGLEWSGTAWQGLEHFGTLFHLDILDLPGIPISKEEFCCQGSGRAIRIIPFFLVESSLFSKRPKSFSEKNLYLFRVSSHSLDCSDSSDSSDPLVICGDVIGDRLILIIKRWPRIRILASSSGALDS